VLPIYPEDEGSLLLRNQTKYLPKYTTARLIFTPVRTTKLETLQMHLLTEGVVLQLQDINLLGPQNTPKSTATSGVL